MSQGTKENLPHNPKGIVLSPHRCVSDDVRWVKETQKFMMTKLDDIRVMMHEWWCKRYTVWLIIRKVVGLMTWVWSSPHQECWYNWLVFLRALWALYILYKEEKWLSNVNHYVSWGGVKEWVNVSWCELMWVRVNESRMSQRRVKKWVRVSQNESCESWRWVGMSQDMSQSESEWVMEMSHGGKKRT